MVVSFQIFHLLSCCGHISFRFTCLFFMIMCQLLPHDYYYFIHSMLISLIQFFNQVSILIPCFTFIYIYMKCFFSFLFLKFMRQCQIGESTEIFTLYHWLCLQFKSSLPYLSSTLAIIVFISSYFISYFRCIFNLYKRLARCSLMLWIHSFYFNNNIIIISKLWKWMKACFFSLFSSSNVSLLLLAGMESASKS